MPGAEIEAKLNDALAQAVRDEGELATKWICLAEVIGPDGERALRTMASEGLTAWESKGLLSEALDTERAATFARAVRE
jgi:hypothetical protein